MRSLKGLLVLMLLFVFAFSVVAASKEETQTPVPAGAAGQTTTPEGVSKEKAEKAPAQSATGSAPAIKPPAPPGKSLKEEGC